MKRCDGTRTMFDDPGPLVCSTATLGHFLSTARCKFAKDANGILPFLTDETSSDPPRSRRRGAALSLNRLI